MIYLLLTWLAAPVLWWRASRRKTSDNNRVLVVQTAKLGDFISTTSVFRALRMRLPEAGIVALVHPANQPLAEGLSSIDRVIPLPAGGFKGWAGKRWLLGILAEGYDAVVVLSPNLTALLAPFWAGVPQRVSVLPDRNRGSARLAYPFLTHGEPHRRDRLFRETALHSLAGLGIVVDQALMSLPNEVSRNEDGETKRHVLLETRPGPFVGLGLGAGNRMKALDQQQLRELAVAILDQSAATIVLTGTAVDQATAAALRTALPAERVIDTTGKWTLAELPSLLAGLDCFVGVDSGATYMADALGIPVVDFMGPADADDQRPLGTRAVVIRSSEVCAPCSHAFHAPYVCARGDRICMKAANLGRMVTAALNILDGGTGK